MRVYLHTREVRESVSYSVGGRGKGGMPQGGLDGFRGGPDLSEAALLFWVPLTGGRCFGRTNMASMMERRLQL